MTLIKAGAGWTTDENGVEYSAVGVYSCDQLVDIDEGSIEECYV